MEDDISKRANWIKRSAPYRDGRRLSPQKDDDLIARRMLSGLGFTSKGIYDFERYLGISPDASIPYYDRVEAAVRQSSGGMFAPSSGGAGYGLQRRPCDWGGGLVRYHVDDLVETASAFGNGLVVMARVGGDKKAVAHVVVPDGEIPPWLLQPVSVLEAKAEGYSIWAREVSELFRDMAGLCRWDLPQ